MKKVKAHTRQTAPTNKEIAELLEIPLWQFYDYMKDRKTRPAIINRDMTIDEMHVAVNHYKEYGHKHFKIKVDIETEPGQLKMLSMEELESCLLDLAIEMSETIQEVVERIREIRRTLSSFKI